jgi:lincosamide nucleotidyltransferase A/C/D/E
MEAGDVVRLLKLLEQEKIGVAVDGGWGTDALLGRQTRPHEDLDSTKTLIKLRKLLKEKGYKKLLQPGSSDFNFVLGNALGTESRRTLLHV